MPPNDDNHVIFARITSQRDKVEPGMESNYVYSLEPLFKVNKGMYKVPLSEEFVLYYLPPTFQARLLWTAITCKNGGSFRLPLTATFESYESPEIFRNGGGFLSS